MQPRRRRKLHLDRSTVKRLTGLALARANGGGTYAEDPNITWARSDVRYCIDDNTQECTGFPTLEGCREWETYIC